MVTVEESPVGKFDEDLDANANTAFSNSCEGNFTGILALHSHESPRSTAWRQMMRHTEIADVNFIETIENQFNNVINTTPLQKFINFTHMVEATERSMHERGSNP